MALLTLVRHGQASFLETHYDRLSERGERQSRALGEYWARTRTAFDQVYHGPAERHIRTGELVAEAYQSGGLTWPESVLVPDLDEYPGIELMRTFLPGLMEKHEDIRALGAEFREAGEKSVAARVYDRLFQRITRMWVAGELDSPEVESWQSFCERVDRGITRIREAAAKNGSIVAFTSGGVIAATARIALDLSPYKTLELSWSPRNATYSEFRFSGERFSLSSFNNLPHLQESELVTYR
jgi:broad specificity phosphatase PhoE